MFPRIGERLAFWIMAIVAVLLVMLVAYYLISPYVDLPETDLCAFGVLLVLLLALLVADARQWVFTALQPLAGATHSFLPGSSESAGPLSLRC